MSNFHFPVINYVGKVESGPAIFFDDDKVIKLDKIDSPIILINEEWRELENISPDSHCIRFAFQYPLLYLLHSQFRASTIIRCSYCVITIALLIILFAILGWLLLTLLFNLTVGLCFPLMGAKTWICEIIFKKHFLNVFVQCQALTLYVGLVFRVGVVHRLVGVDVEPLQSVKYVFKWALNVAVLFLFNIDLLGRYLICVRWTSLDFSVRIIDWRVQFLTLRYASFLLEKVRTWPWQWNYRKSMW